MSGPGLDDLAVAALNSLEAGPSGGDITNRQSKAAKAGIDSDDDITDCEEDTEALQDYMAASGGRVSSLKPSSWR